MEVILKKNIRNLGYKNDVVNVKNGYGRNYLIPKKIATLATETNKKILKEDLKQKAFKEEKIKKQAQTVVQTLKDVSIKIGAKVGTSGKIFGSVNNIQISEAIKKQCDIEIDRKKIALDSENIKKLGTYTAKIDLYKDITVDLSFEVVAE